MESLIMHNLVTHCRKSKWSIILFVIAVSAINASAAWKAGLNEYLLSGAESLSIGVYPDTVNGVTMGPEKGRQKSWGDKKTYIYKGQIYLDGSKYWFGESIDDATYLKIDGTQVIYDTTWSNFAKGSIQRDAGWYDFEVRFYNGGGGCGVANNTVDKNGASCGFGLYKSETAPTAMSVCEFPIDDGNMTLFRHDDGLGFEDELLVAQSPIAIPVSYSPSTTTSGLAVGSTVQCSSDASYQAQDGSMRATLTGYVVSNNVNGVYGFRSAGNGVSLFSYEHDGNANTLYWLWNIDYYLTVGVNGAGTVDVSSGWQPLGTMVTLTATSSAADSYFAGWQGDVDAAQISQSTITVTMDQARTLTANFSSPEIYVDGVNGSDSNSGLSADYPKKTFGAAMTVATDGFTVHVRPSTYTVSAETVVDHALTIVGDGASPSDVIIQGNNSFRIFKLDNANARLVNLTISKGRVNGSSAQNLTNGGNILITGAGGTVSNCVISFAQHIYYSRGAGVYIESANGVVTDSVIRDCYMTDGNGQHGTAFAITAGCIERCLITHNFIKVYASNNNDHGVGYVEGGLVKNCTIADNIHGRNILYVRGGEIRNCVIARNYTLRTARSSQINVTAALKPTVFVDSVWDQGALNDDLPQGDVKFVDFAAGDFRLASGSVGAFDGSDDWGYVNCDTHDAAAAESASVTLESDGDIRMALRQLADGGEIVLKSGTYKVSTEPLCLVRGVMLRSESGNPGDVIITKGSTAPNGPLVATANADTVLTGITFCDNAYNGNVTSSGIHMIYGGGVVSNCVMRKFAATSNNHGGTAIRVECAGAHVTRCVITNNTNHANTGAGGAVYMSGNSLIDNCLIADCNNDTWNSPTSSHWSKDTPGAIYQSAGTIANCTIVNCKAPRVAVAKTTGGTIRDTIIFGNERTNTNYPETETLGIGAGLANWSHIVSDITLVGTDGKLATVDTIGFIDAERGDWRLTTDSIAKNACAKYPAAGVSKIDLAGNPRRVSPRVDAGCYERPGEPAMKLMLK